MKHTLLFTAVAMTSVALPPAMANDYPNRPIEIIVPAPAGGGTDNVARMLNQYLQEELGQPVAVLNVAGGGGAIGVNQLARSRPDGYTLLSTWNSPITTVPHTQRVQYSYETLTPIISPKVKIELTSGTPSTTSASVSNISEFVLSNITFA